MDIITNEKVYLTIIVIIVNVWYHGIKERVQQANFLLGRVFLFCLNPWLNRLSIRNMAKVNTEEMMGVKSLVYYT